MPTVFLYDIKLNPYSCKLLFNFDVISIVNVYLNEITNILYVLLDVGKYILICSNNRFVFPVPIGDFINNVLANGNFGISLQLI